MVPLCSFQNKYSTPQQHTTLPSLITTKRLSNCLILKHQNAHMARNLQQLLLLCTSALLMYCYSQPLVLSSPLPRKLVQNGVDDAKTFFHLPIPFPFPFAFGGGGGATPAFEPFARGGGNTPTLGGDYGGGSPAGGSGSPSGSSDDAASSSSSSGGGGGDAGSSSGGAIASSSDTTSGN
ncbi:hypothetical protein KP509_21G088800 [Ceratopteris richardii]|uniref:Uncharacterized protein n=1 Tax=Ceratopteris richardii TaxID=49495 RepID=A0A8T2SFP8_CERRI|nr:hypothetical protein KP509_21G088800 [Ceratopteris richardii]